MSARRPGKWRLLALLAGLLVVADQATKFLAVERLTVAFQRSGARTLAAKITAFWEARHLESLATEPYVVFAPLWRMNYVENPGAAWGLFRAATPAFRNGFFALVTVGAVAFIVHYYRKLDVSQRFLQVALAFVLSGALGNFIDRLARSYVIDFVEWHWWNRPDIRWPTFNLADSLIVVGVAMLVVHPAHGRAAPADGNERAGPSAG